METAAAAPLWTAPRAATISTWRALNSSLDTVFYDVDALSTDERSQLTTHLAPEGAVVVVWPGKANRAIQTCTPRQFVREHREGANAVDVLVVAGVGSSALGTASLARNVADYLACPVAGVVSGFGLADVLSEALCGWYVFGAHNALRQAYAMTFDAFGLKDHVRDADTHADLKAHLRDLGLKEDRFLYGSPDSATVLYLLLTMGARLRLLVGHSKGNCSLENALEGWAAAHRKTEAFIKPDLCIVTLGAVLWFPDEFTNVHQVIGTLDGLGMVNSRPGVPYIPEPGAWHSLNAEWVGHLSVAQALRDAGIPPAGAAGASAAG